MRRQFPLVIKRWRTSLLFILFGLTALLALPAAAAGQCAAPSFNAPTNVRVGFRPLQITKGDFNGDGRVDFVVPSSSSPKLRFLMGNGTAVPTVFTSDVTPSRLAVADFNRDGKLDLAVVHGTFSTTFVAILSGDGAGGYTQASDTQVPTADRLLAADFNNDQKPDLFLGNSSTNNSHILLGDGLGGVASSFSVVVPNNEESLAGDFNNDGKTDLVLVFGSVSLALGDGTGHFGPASTTFVNVRAARAADVNADGKLDLVGAGPGGLSVLLGDGAGGFPTVSSFATGFSAFAVAVGDFNGDGKPDAAPTGNKVVALLLGDGGGGFGAPTSYTLTQSPIGVEAGDVDGDGKLDLVTANVPPDGSFPDLDGPKEDTATVLLGDGAGKLRYPSVLTTGANPFSVAAGDLNGDGKPDLALANISDNTVSLLPGDGEGGFGAPASFPVGTQPRHVASADLNGDGRLDIVTANFSASTISVLLADGEGGFGAATQLSLPGSGPTNVAAGDFNNDGKPDLAVAYLNASFVSILPGDGAGGFAPAVNTAVPSGAQQVTVNDFNGDGRSDLAVATTGGLAVLLGDGAGGFGAAQVLQSANSFSAVGADDFNADGKADLAAADRTAVLVFSGDGQGGFSAPLSSAVIDAPASLVVGDYNGDSRPDVATANGNGTVSVLLGAGEGVLALQVAYVTPGPVPRWIASADFNSDGRPDLAVANQGGNVLPTPNPPPGNAAVLINKCSAPPVSVPGMSVSDVTVTEGDSGTTNATFTISLSAPSGRTVAASFYAAPGEALPGSDYEPALGRVTLAPGVTSQSITVPVKADLLDEFDETFLVLLTHPLNAEVSARGRGTILDDDPPPAASIGDVTLSEGDAGTKQANFNVSLSAASGKPITVSYATADGSATAGSDYQAAAGDLTFPPGQTTRTISVAVNGDTGVEPDETFLVNLSAPVNVTLADAQGQALIRDDDTPVLQFSQATYPASEGGHFVTITVTRSGGATLAVAVDYATGDGTATERNDYAAALGTLRFGAGETAKSFDVLITDDAFQEQDETINLTLSNPTGVAVLGARPTATVVIAADDNPPPNSNPIDEPLIFVRQHYHDFLGREPDAAGLQFWANEITSCGSDAPCREVKRVNVSAAFFLSIENQESGYLVHRAYKAAYGDLPNKPVPLTLREYLSGARKVGEGVQVGVGDWQQRLEANKVAFFNEFVNTPRFAALYGGLTNGQYVDALSQNAGGALSQAESDALKADLASMAKTRAQVLRAVAENGDFAQAEKNRAFVLAQYFGYLRRNPDDVGFDGQADPNFLGYHFWLGKLNDFNGNFVQAEMVRAFINSIEYRQRFGQ